MPITLVRLGAFQIGDYYKKIKEHLEQVLNEPWVTDLGREFSWIMSALQKSEDNKKKLQQKIINKNPAEMSELNDQYNLAHNESFQEILDRIDDGTKSVQQECLMVLKRPDECICDKCKTVLSDNSQEQGQCVNCKELILITNLYRPVDKLPNVNSNDGLGAVQGSAPLMMPELCSLHISGYSQGNTAGAVQNVLQQGSQLNTIAEEQSPERSLEFKSTSIIKGYSPSKCRAKNQAALDEVLYTGIRSKNVDSLRPSSSYDKESLNAVYHNIVNDSSTPTSAYTMKRAVNLASRKIGGTNNGSGLGFAQADAGYSLVSGATHAAQPHNEGGVNEPYSWQNVQASGGSPKTNNQTNVNGELSLIHI